MTTDPAKPDPFEAAAAIIKAAADATPLETVADKVVDQSRMDEGLRNTEPDTLDRHMAGQPAGDSSAPPKASAKKGPVLKLISGGGKADRKPGGRAKRPRASSVIMQVLDGCRYWRDRNGASYVTFPYGAHLENAAVRSMQFKQYVSHRVYSETGIPPSNQSTEDALKICEALAFESDPQDTMLRVGSYGPDAYLLDLCDRERRYIAITKHGWEIREDGKNHFLRSAGMLPLFQPEPGGGIEALRPFVNVASEHDFILVVACLVAYLRPAGPYPILVVNGEQGSGKSTFSRVIRALVDPNTAPIRAVPRDDRDLMVGAYNSHFLCFDNISKLAPEMSDSLCRIVTGGGWAFRQLFADLGEVIFYGSRVVILNGIPVFAERADLADRSIGIRLVSISETQRQTEADFWRDFERAAPAILGALLDAAATGIKRLPETHLDRLPRLADFARWVVACEPGLGWQSGTFLTAYDANRRDVNEGAFEADAVAIAVRDFIIEDHPRGWTGTPTELHAALNIKVSEEVRRSKAWPWTLHAMGSRIDRATPLLRRRGIIIERRNSGGRLITIVQAETTTESNA